MPNKLDQLIEELERLDMEDQESRGCTVTLAEWMNNDNMEVLSDFIRHVYASACEEIARKIPAIEDKETDTSETRVFLSALNSARQIALDEGSNARKKQPTQAETSSGTTMKTTEL